jgi:hypothetical protein
MAIVITADLPNGTAEIDKSVMEKLNMRQSPAPGSLMRLAGPGPNGGWRVVSVWESRELFDQFRRERLEPVLKDAGQALPQYQYWTAESVMVPPK